MRQVAQRSERPRRGERGLTLVELLVAMVVLMIVFAMVLRTLGDATTAKNAVQRDAKMGQKLDETVNHLSTDLRVAGHPRRDDATRKELLAGAIGGEDIRDIKLASQFELRVVADAVASPTGQPQAFECIIYRVDANGSLWRAASSDGATCRTDGAYLLELQRLMAGAAAQASEAADRASFGTRMNGSLRAAGHRARRSGTRYWTSSVALHSVRRFPRSV